MTESLPPWKALVLAAGYGRRLLPHTRRTPKPLFTIAGIPVIDHVINLLVRAGCGGIVVNTHHLHEKLARHFNRQNHGIPVRLSYEPDILGTGGAIRNNLAFLGQAPFLVINSDIYTTIDLAAVYNFHSGHDDPVTLVMRDDPRFNTVTVNNRDEVTGFEPFPGDPPESARRLTFTGIQVLNPSIGEVLPPTGRFGDIISSYRSLLQTGRKIKACLPENGEWDDIGTPPSYRHRAFHVMARQSLQQAFGKTPSYTVKSLPADGSDTIWTRIDSCRGSLIACNRGIRADETTTETDSLAHILPHLFQKGIPVPRLYGIDTFAGLAFMEDLGDVNLQAAARKKGLNDDDLAGLYQPVINHLVELATVGVQGFDASWTCQTKRYDKNMILEKECRYFTTAFLSGWLNLEPDDGEQLADDFNRLAEATLAAAIDGLMHRDMQSRNVMIHKGRPFFIDLQGARFGPVQYDLASLLIDPYVALPAAVQNRLAQEYSERLSRRRSFSRELFQRGYACCAVTRNLQILGAFAFLTRKKGKSRFSSYIRPAAASLPGHVQRAEQATGQSFPALLDLARQASQATTG
ncbi:MAG: sugar phosphate nucleotidyltransferase [Desulfosudaceae bacterium]